MKALSLRGIGKTYSNGVQALRSIDLDVQPGEFCALLGPNGAGKSTAIGIISSLVTKSVGTVEIMGHNLDRTPMQAKRCLGLVPQEFNFNQFEKVADILVTQAGFYGIPPTRARDRVEELLHQLDLWDKRQEAARALSGGMKRRLMIARAMVHDPPLLILDEPTAGVDIGLRRSMWDFLRAINAAGKTIILTTHYLEEAESLCKRIAIIDHGRLIEDTLKHELLARLHHQSFLLDVDVIPDPLPDLGGCQLTQVDAQTLEVSVPAGIMLDGVFGSLAAAGTGIRGMRNKSNRLEELFLQLVESGEDSR